VEVERHPADPFRSSTVRGRIPMSNVHGRAPTARRNWRDRALAAGALLRSRPCALALWALVAASVAAIWFGSLGWRHLVPSDEGRYAEIAREMFASGDWVTVRYQGLKYFEKPPFQMWATALAYGAFGIGDWQARLWTGLSGLLGLGVIAHAARRWFGARVGALAALSLLAMPAWVLAGHVNSLDMGVGAALAVVLGAWLVALSPVATPQERARWMLVAWGAAAVAVLTKGLIGVVLPAMVLLLHAALHRRAVPWRRLRAGVGIPLLLAIAAPWFLLVSARNPEFARFFFIHEHFERYTSEVHQRGAPVWYFVPQLALGLLPWLGLLPAMWRSVRAESRASTQARDLRPLALLATWALAIFAFFSASGSKLPGYIVPVYPALGILAAVALDTLPERAWKRLLWSMAAIFAVGCGVALAGAARLANEAVLDVARFLVGAALATAVALLATVIAVRLSDRGAPFASRAAYALGAFLATTIAIVSHEAVGGPRSGAALVPAVQRVLNDRMPIYGVRYLDHTLPFYLRHTLVMVAAADELAFGVQQEPDKWIPTLDAFRRVWSQGPPALALMTPETWGELRAQGFDGRPVAADRRRIVIANPGVPR
jgi:4-amino-4-deoxy-L-arabinose transferase-like glycosyltransferase